MDIHQFLKFVSFERIPYALLVIFGTWFVLQLAGRFFNVLAERFTHRRLVFKQLGAISRFTLVLLASVVVAGSLIHFSDEALLAIGGSLALALGFAFKDLLTSLMAGLILLFDRPFRAGDRIQFGGQYGEVQEIGLRSVRLITLDDNLVSIPNSQFLTDLVASANAGALDQMCVFDFYIGCLEDFETAKVLTYEAAASSRYVYLGKPITVALWEGPVEAARDLFAIRLTVKAYVFDGRYEIEFRTDVAERVKRAFRQHGIRSLGELTMLGFRPDTPPLAAAESSLSASK